MYGVPEDGMGVEDSPLCARPQVFCTGLSDERGGPEVIGAQVWACGVLDTDEEGTVKVIERLRELEKAATPGPWDEDDIGDITGLHGRCVCDFVPMAADRGLIAANRNALPALLDVAEAAANCRTRGDSLDWKALDKALADLKAVKL